MSMDKKLLGFIIVGFGLLLLFSEEKYSFWFSAIALCLVAGFVIQKPENNHEEK